MVWITGRGGRIGRAQASPEGDREFGSQLSQPNDLSNVFLWLPSLALGIKRIVQGLVSELKCD